MAKAPNPKDPDGAKAKAAEAAKERAREKAKTFHDYEVVVHVDDQAYKFCAGDVTARHVGQLRRVTGSELGDPVYFLLLVLVEGEVPSPDLVAQLVYLAELQAGAEVSFDSVQDEITGRSVVWLEFPEDPETGTVVTPDPGGGEGPVYADPLPSGGS